MSEKPGPDVRELIERAQEGDDECRDQLFGLCRSYLGFVARAQVETWLRAKVDASDVVQQTMLEAHRDFNRFQGRSEKEWLGWLRKILSHNVSDFVRHYRGTAKRQARREVRFRDPAETGFTGGGAAGGDRPNAQPGANASGRRVARVSAALAELSPDYQEVIVLRNLQRLSFNEVAERMSRSRPAVQMLWMRAIGKLQKVMEEERDEGRGARD